MRALTILLPAKGPVVSQRHEHHFRSEIILPVSRDGARRSTANDAVDSIEATPGWIKQNLPGARVVSGGGPPLFRCRFRGHHPRRESDARPLFLPRTIRGWLWTWRLVKCRATGSLRRTIEPALRDPREDVLFGLAGGTRPPNTHGRVWGNAPPRTGKTRPVADESTWRKQTRRRGP